MQLDPLRLGQGEAGAPGQQDQRLLPPVELHAVEVQRDPSALIDSDGTAARTGARPPADGRRIATRYDRCAKTFLSAVTLAATVIFWL